eukprot:gene6466-7199_t
MVNATPGVSHFMDYDLQTVDGKVKIKVKDDSTYVFNRPKYFVSSSGCVWASEYMRLRYEEPALFLTESRDTGRISFLLKIGDSINLYLMSTNDEDLRNVSSQLNQIHNLQSESINLDERLKRVEEGAADMTVLFKDQCQNVFNCIQQFIPSIKSRVHEFTDGGLGVAVTNQDVKLYMALTVSITNSDYYIRHHSTNGYGSHNEVERCQSYVGDAICDGGPIEWEYRKEFHNLSDQELEMMSLEDLEQTEFNRMKYNTFKVCDELKI